MRKRFREGFLLIAAFVCLACPAASSAQQGQNTNAQPPAGSGAAQNSEGKGSASGGKAPAGSGKGSGADSGKGSGADSGKGSGADSGKGSGADSGSASDLPTVNPYRPTVTDPATLTYPGFLEMEIGGAAQHGGQMSRHAFATPTVLKLTTSSKRLEYHVFFAGYGQQTLQDGTSQSGHGDLTPGLQYLIMQQTPKTYDVSARVEYKVPLATHGLGTGKTDYDLLLLASKDYNDTLHADYNLGIYKLGRMSGQGFATQYQASGVLNTKLTDKLTLQDELYGFSGSSEGATIVSTLHAIGFQPSRVLAFDAGVDIGISHAAPHYTLLFGSTFFVGRLF